MGLVDAVAELAALLRLPPVGAPAGDPAGWAAAETALGTELPSDYKRFVDAYGPGLVNDHLSVCAPDSDLLDNNEMAQESCRIWFGDIDDDSSGLIDQAWPLGDSSRWTGDDVPDWFQPGDDLVSWGATGNGDFLFRHVRPGVAADDHPVVLRERGPYFERFEAGFAKSVTGLLTGAIPSRYLTRWLRAPHSYRRQPTDPPRPGARA